MHRAPLDLEDILWSIAIGASMAFVGLGTLAILARTFHLF